MNRTMRNILLLAVGVAVVLLVIQVAQLNRSPSENPTQASVPAAQPLVSAVDAPPPDLGDPGILTPPDIPVPPDGPGEASGPPPPQTDGRPDTPPAIGDAEAGMAAQMHQLVRQHLREGGPTTAPLAQDLIASDDPLLRATGAALLSELGKLTDELLRQIAEDPDKAVPLSVLGWLRDGGHAEDANTLIDELGAGGMTPEQMLAILNGGQLDSSAGRAVLDLIGAGMDAGEALGVYSALSGDPHQDYSLRMMAALAMRDTLPFPEYRSEIAALKSEAGDDEVWLEGLARLGERLAGPLPLRMGPVELKSSDIDLMVAREYPKMLEDLALWIEYALNKDDAIIQRGVSERLFQHLEAFDRRPWTEEEMLSLRRVHTALDQLVEAEAQRGINMSSDLPPM